MIFKRFSKHVRDHDWFAVSVDFVILVVGVFIGLQVTEWGQTRADRASEASAIERLIVEYERNLEILADDRNKSVRVMRASAGLMELIEPEPDPGIDDAQVGQLLGDCLMNPVFTPALGVTNSLLASGELGLIQDPEIQRTLSEWSAAADMLDQWQEIERHHGEELILGLTYEYLAWPNVDNYFDGSPAVSKLESDYQGLFSSKRFEGLLNNRWYNLRVAIERIDALQIETRRLLDRLEARRKAI